jgi:general L-amino acid transport system ATP-binding protein
VIVIFGPSGSGKSTFIRTINRLEEHQRGQIIVDGIELSHDVRNIEKIRMETGMVFQQFNLFPHLTVMQNITLSPIWVRKWTKEKAEEIAMQLLERVASRSRRTNIPVSFPADSSSAWRSPARWRCSPRSCCSTSRPPRSTRR